jgi:hypothetical protein
VLCIELCAGSFGWGAGFIAEGFRVVGFDIMDVEKELGVKRTLGCELVLQDILTLHGAQFKDAHCIVASPPCQFFSYTAMPWSRAKRLAEEVRNDPARLMQELALFEACFRIQREASEAAGRYIPMVVENVVGAQKWFGPAKWHYGSFYLWGDVPALMPFTNRPQKHDPRGYKDNGGSWFNVSMSDVRHGREGVKAAGRNFHGPERGTSSPSFNGGEHEMRGVKTEKHVNQRDGFKSTAHLTRQFESDRIRERGAGVTVAENGMKQGGDWFGPGENMSISRRYSSRSNARKAASAMIAKIPFPLALHIARAFKAWKEK